MSNQQRFEEHLRRVWTTGYACQKKPDGTYIDAQAQMLWETWQEARKDIHVPLTPYMLADSLSCFWNAALGSVNEGGSSIIAVVNGIDAVSRRLSEHSHDNNGPTI